MNIKKTLRGLKQRIIDVDFGRLKDKIAADKFFSRTIRKIIEIDVVVLAFLTVILVAIGSLVGFGICTLRQGDKQSESSGELESMVQELETELSNIREVLEDRNSEIQALNSSLGALRPGDRPRILSVRIDLSMDNICAGVDMINFGYSIFAIGVKSVDPESEWYYQDPILGTNTATKFDFYWLEELAEAPEGFLAPDTWYRVAIWYDGGYDEVTANSSEVENGDQIAVSKDGATGVEESN